ncbi:hypothetical protein ADUPG1_004203, partial [Aduncisulcus paluster]
LEEFDFDIEHVSGTANVLADALSRLRTRPTESMKRISELKPAKRLVNSLKLSQESKMLEEETSSLKKRPDGIWANKEGLAVVPSADSSLKNMLMEFAHGKGKAHLGEEAS